MLRRVDNPHACRATLYPATVPFGVAATTIDDDFLFGGDDDFVGVLRDVELGK